MPTLDTKTDDTFPDQATAIDQGHREVMNALLLANLVDWHNAGMIEVCRRFRLGMKPLHIVLAGQLPR